MKISRWSAGYSLVVETQTWLGDPSSAYYCRLFGTSPRFRLLWYAICGIKGIRHEGNEATEKEKTTGVLECVKVKG